MEEKDTVEVIADSQITGVISEVGDNYITVVYAVERKIEEEIVITEGDHKGEKEKQILIQVIELETLLRFKDIRAVSKIVKKKFK